MNKNLSYIALAVTALLSPSPAIADAHNKPDLPQEYIELMGKADIAIADKNWDEAEQYLLQALSSNPDNPLNVLILSNLGVVQYNLGRDSLALWLPGVSPFFPIGQTYCWLWDVTASQI